MDRIAPTQRPHGRNDGTQRWRDLLFVHYDIPVEVVRALVPPSLDLDLWNGRAYVGVVPFAMRNIAPARFPSALGLNFLETNVRTYVHHRDHGPGVYFFSLDASSTLAVRVARAVWKLPYYRASMRCVNEGGVFAYSSRRSASPAMLDARWRVGESIGTAVPGTIEHFLLERYLLYVERDATLLVGQVNHTPYPAHRAELLGFEETLLHAAGITQRPEQPAFVHASPGVDVEVFALRPAPWHGAAG